MGFVCAFVQGHWDIPIAPVNKLVSLTWLLWALRSFRSFTLHYITSHSVYPVISGESSNHENQLGPSIKYATLKGEGVREGVTVCDRGRGSGACDVTLIHFLSYI